MRYPRRMIRVLRLIMACTAVYGSIALIRSYQISELNHDRDAKRMETIRYDMTITDIIEDGERHLRDLYNYSLTITQETLETLKAALPPVLLNYKNPCWYEPVTSNFQYNTYQNKYIPKSQQIIDARCTNYSRKLYPERDSFPEDSECWRLRCFPYFFLIGAAKTATTDMYQLLTAFHPDVVNISVKEPFYWGSDRIEKGGATFAQYLDVLDYPAETIRKNSINVNGETFHPAIVGDFSPNTYNGAPHWNEWVGNINQSEPRITTPHMIHNIRPETKIIFSMREPVARMISHYFYGPEKKNCSTEDLHTFCKDAILLYHQCTSNNSVRHCVYSHSNVLNRGLYYIFIHDWLKLFPLQQVFVMNFEYYIEHRVRMLDMISAFLEIGSIPPQYHKDIAEYRVRNINKDKALMDPIPTAVLDMLTEFYKPWQSKMEDLIKHDKRLWRYDEETTVDVMTDSDVSALIDGML